MSTMPATHGHSAACCNIPPIVSEGYQKKGSFEELGGHNTCKLLPLPCTTAGADVYRRW